MRFGFDHSECPLVARCRGWNKQRIREAAVTVGTTPAPTSTLVIFKFGTLRSSGLGGIGGELATATVHLELSTRVVAY